MEILMTVTIYIMVYSIATLFFVLANNTKDTFRQKIFLVLAILFLSSFAAIRDISVGTDTYDTISLYFTDQYQKSIRIESITDIVNGDFVYFIMSNIIHFFGGESGFFLFIIELSILTPVIISSYIERKRIPIYIFMGIFLLLYYQINFNWIRQSVASGWLLLTVVCMQNKQIKSAILSALIAVLFHSSAIIGLSLLGFSYAFIKIKNRMLRVIWGIILTGIFIILLTQWDTVFSLAVSYGIFPERYLGYIRVYTGESSVDSWFLIGLKAYAEYVLRIALVLIPFVFVRQNLSTSDSKNIVFYRTIAVVSIVIYSYIFLVMHSAYGNRITYAVDYIQILNLGMCYSLYNGRRGVIPIKNICLTGFIIFYNLWLYYVLGWHDTVPYVFSL